MIDLAAIPVYTCRMTSLIFTLWSAGFAAKVIAPFILWRRGLASRFAALTGLFVILAAQSLVAAIFSSNMAAYTRVFALIAWTWVFFEGIAITSAYWMLTEHYPRYRKAGSVLLGILSLTGAALCFAFGYVTPPPAWRGLWHSAVWAQQGIGLVMVVVLIGARIFVPRVRSIPVATSARRVADILTLHVTLAMTSAMLVVAGSNAAASLIAVSNGLLLGVLCIAFLTRESDIVIVAQSLPALSAVERKQAAQSSALLWEGFRDFTRMLSRR